jgi:hypothetical protein
MASGMSNFPSMKTRNILAAIAGGYRLMLVYPDSEVVMIKDRKAYRGLLKRSPELLRVPHVTVSIREVVGSVSD